MTTIAIPSGHRGVRKHKQGPLTKTARRLLKLADLLEDVPADNFDMSRWMGTLIADGHVDSMDEVGDMYRMTGSLNCGTKACVAGWAAVMWRDELPKRGDDPRAIVQVALDLLGLDYSGQWNPDGHDLFSSSAPWQSPSEAAAECRTRAINIIEELNQRG